MSTQNYKQGDLVEFIDPSVWGYLGNRFYVIEFDAEMGSYKLGPTNGFEILVYALPEEIRKIS